MYTATTVPAYSAMKPSGGATPFLASSLEPRRRARGYSRVQGGGERDGLGTQKKKFTVGPLWTVNGELTPTASEWTLPSKRNRLSAIELVGVAAEHGAAAAIPTRECSWPPTSTAKFR